MNLLSFFFLLSSLVTLALGVWVVSANTRNKVYFTWFLFCSSVALWSFGLGVLTIAPNLLIANFFYFIHYLGAINIPIMFLCFIRVYFLHDAKPQNSPDSIIGYVLAVFQIISFYTGHLVGPLTPKWHFNYYTNPGVLYPFFAAYFFAYVNYCFFLMLRAFWCDKTLREKRNVFIIVATACGFTGGSTAFFLVYNIDLPPYGIFCFLLFPIITSYAIIKHGLMEIEIIIRKTIVFAGLFGVLMAIVGTVTALAQSYVGQLSGIGETTRQILSIFLAMLLFDPTRKLLAHLTDKFLFQKKYDYHKLLKDASRGMSNIESLEHLLGLVVHFITMKMRVKNAAVLMREGTSDQYHLAYQRGFDKKFLMLTLYQNDPLIHYLENHKEAVDIERIKEQVEARQK